MKVPTDEELLALAKVLKDTYENFPRSSITPTYYRNKDQWSIVNFEHHRYTPLNCEFFIFLVLYSHNTRDVQTYKVFRKIRDLIESKNLKQFNFAQYFYKRKSLYQTGLRLLKNHILQALHNNEPLLMRDLIGYPGVGIKSASILINHFSQPYSHPVVDINVYKAFRAISLLDTKNPDQVYHNLIRLGPLTEDDHAPSKICDYLWMHRKLCLKRTPSCYRAMNSANLCDLCKTLNTKYLEHLNKESKV